MCQKKVSYLDSLVKFKLVSRLLDSEIKDFTKEGFPKCPVSDKICQKCGIKSHYKDTERCNNPRAAYSRIK